MRQHGSGSHVARLVISVTLAALGAVPMPLPATALTAKPATQPTVQAGAATEPLAAFAPLIGSWLGTGTGFSTTLRYTWEIEGRVLGVSNEVRDAKGGSIARYRGAYAWDAGRQQIVFWVTSYSGEVHRGRAWWSDGVLWHEAEVSGGRIKSYASAVRPRAGGFEYFAAYGASSATPSLLDGTPIVYRPVSDGADARRPVGP